LVALIRQGRRAAFEAAYDRHHRSILSFCRHMLGDHEEAEDAVQHTFLAAYSDLVSSDKPIHLRAWLFTIARNRCYSILRSRREHPTGDLEEPATEGLATQVQRRQDLRDLVFDMQHLPEEQRAALVLAELDSLSHEQIGLVLGVPREKVKALVFQARESLVASRTARETDCSEIREQLANMRGGALRRSNLRRHLRECQGCRDFRKQVERQRRQLALLIPVAPTIALKEGVMGGSVGSTVGIGAAGGGLIASSAIKAGVVKAILGATLAGVGAAGAIVAVHDIQRPQPRALSAAKLSPAAPNQSAGHSASRASAAANAGSAASGTLPVVTWSRLPASGGTGGSWTRLALMNLFAPVFPTASPFRTGTWSHRHTKSRATAVAAPLPSAPAGTAPSPATSQQGALSILGGGSPASRGSAGSAYPSNSAGRSAGTQAAGGSSSSGFPGAGSGGSSGGAARSGPGQAGSGTNSAVTSGGTGQGATGSAYPYTGSGITSAQTPTGGNANRGASGDGVIGGQPGSSGSGSGQPTTTSTVSSSGGQGPGSGTQGSGSGLGSGSGAGGSSSRSGGGTGGN
jgi:RNA polymerase sigma factor (sigma-70 family)